MKEKNLHSFDSIDSIAVIDEDRTMPSIVNFVCRLMLILSHSLFWLLKLTNIYFINLYHHLRSHWINIDSQTKSNLSRVPMNLAICIGLEDSKIIDMNIIGQLLCWCQTLSIKTLTIYHYCDAFPELNNNTLNGIEVQTISLSSSHQSLIESVRKICQQKLPITSEQISQYLRQQGYYKFDDPDLLICFNGDQRSLQAFPPWQIRLTEIVFLQSHRLLNKSQFLYILKQFSRCEQRFGK
uniref:ditrans,polycis-polyprenyl diphosphate synthase [(2E,6E)-farnesyldiphosphate specific] n=1 Tax=Dermatophagoides pteronyssinus TaxID=6956 RepID=A0A6P6XUD1_DERPT|nr:dehydrodolichyl diphosphate synthase complex subunit Nus1-like [Dermatophagoides pteronyssinus]